MHQKVITSYQKAMDLSVKANKDPNIHFELGVSNYKQGNFNEAEQNFNNVNKYSQKYVYQHIIDLYRAIIKKVHNSHLESAKLFFKYSQFQR
ncbi:kelch motif family protein, putative [Ichthyophthirius multifiliis]|uniref:Kelch motif family protein, putative n=1 Tax=Ichthyophthirius multifiliis TaxID=5932 RepID=G0R5Y6_ICHMU|nr:kelch motif family protein, putative [Ichthyophthirius multifiliis]EGR27110.1 kelch motif family protein, putative [Ichthyophthirius multifiliis]|eukprot:XP_004023994.1 kelch motif family protein, putative [Ichthyophthirius multifiliis]